jgi:MFS family permease
MSYIIDFSLFRRNRNFSFLFIGQFVSFFGTMITSVALPYQIYHLTQSTLMVGLLSLCQLVPLLFTALIGGVFADRYHRRLLLILTETSLALGALALAFNAAMPSPSIWLLFIVATLMGGITGLHRPALDSLVQQIVAKEDYSAVAGIGTFKGSICMIAGPAVGGLIIANFGIVVTFIVDFATFAISLFALFLMTHIPPPAVQQKDISTFASIAQGIKYALSRQELMGTYIVDFIAMIFGMPSALFPAIAQAYGGAQVLGILYAAPAAGAVVVSFFSGWATQVKRHGRAIAIAAVLWGVSIIFFGLVSNFAVSIFFLALAGAFDAISGIFRMTMWNETIPNHLRGRMAGIEMISYLSGPRLGDTEAGLVAAAFGITVSIVSGGVLCVAGVALSCYFLPKFWNYHAERKV